MAGIEIKNSKFLTEANTKGTGNKAGLRSCIDHVSFILP